MKMLVKIMNVIHIVILDGWKGIYMINGLYKKIHRSIVLLYIDLKIFLR